MDNLIMDGWIEPIVVICPMFYQLGCDSLLARSMECQSTYPTYLASERTTSTLSSHTVESTWNTGGSAQRRAFAGLSLGSELTYEMYVNATSHFRYFGLFSGALGAMSSFSTEAYINMTVVSQNPDLATRGDFVGFGNFDIAFGDCRLLQLALEMAGVGYVTRFVPWGSHYWNTWQDTLWYFGRLALWKDRPFTPQTGRTGRIVY